MKKKMYIERNITPIVQELLEDYRIVAISEPRQSGKTTLVKELSNKFFIFIDLLELLAIITYAV
ncbi:MAG: hypothetical protein HF962_06675 [Sulfurovum sp.]|nr:hypothetical protein [Sulfurovum sp.]